MRQTAHEEEYKGCNIKIYHDDCANSPREDDNFGTIVAWHRNYSLSDDKKFSMSLEGWARSIIADEHIEALEKYEEEQTTKLEYTYEATQDELLEYAEKSNLIVPVYMYDHSGIALSTSSFGCRWDSGQVGWIYVSHEKIIKEYGTLDLEKANALLISEVKVYGQYVNGEVYGYVTEDAEGEEIDSCWGFIGYSNDEYMIQQAKDSIDNHEKEKLPLLANAGLLEEV